MHATAVIELDSPSAISIAFRTHERLSTAHTAATFFLRRH